MRVGPSAWLLAGRWGVLALLSLVFGTLLAALRLPAAPLLGPLGAAVVLAIRGGAVRIPRWTFLGAQGVVGVMIASYLSASIFHEMAASWPVFVAGTFSTLSAAALLGWLLTRSRLLPGTTAIWGSSPGAATVMTLMAESYGADMRLVAFMQYLRVACCAVIAAVVARVAGTPSAPLVVVQTLSWQGALLALVIALAGSALGTRLRVPAGGLLVPMGIGMAARLGAHLPIEQPRLLLVAAYALIGWGIGMRFTPDVLAYAGRVFPRVLGSILALITVCGGFALVLARLAHVDLLTAYLATSPGGADSVSIIASTTKVDMPFVIAMQVARFFCVLVTGPALARFLSRRSSGKGQHDMSRKQAKG